MNRPKDSNRFFRYKILKIGRGLSQIQQVNADKLLKTNLSKSAKSRVYPRPILCGYLANRFFDLS